MEQTIFDKYTRIERCNVYRLTLKFGQSSEKPLQIY